LQPTPKIPTLAEVSDAFNERGIEHVGLSVKSPGESSYYDLQRMSQATGTLASGPVDCNGDGTTDIAAGKALVCELNTTDSDAGLNLVPGVTGLLRSVGGLQASVQLETQKGAEVVETTTPEVYESVILQTEKTLSFDVTFHCSFKQAGKKFNVKVAPTGAPGLLGLSADAVVRCKDLPPEAKEKRKERKERKKIPPLAVLPPVIPLVSIAVPPPPPPPAPITELSSASQSQAQSQAQAQAQGAAASQEQEEPQLAFAQAYFEAGDPEYAMSSYNGRSRSPVTPALGVGAVTVSLMYGAGLAARRRMKRAEARWR
jgi:hypothetical protein